MSVTNTEAATASSKQDHTHGVAPPIASEASKKRSEPSATGVPLPTSRQNPKMPRTSTHAGASSSAYLSPAEPVDTNVWPGRAMRMQKAEGVTDDNAMEHKDAQAPFAKKPRRATVVEQKRPKARDENPKTIRLC